MKFFVVTHVHRNLAGWKEHLEVHVKYLEDLASRGVLRASGPLLESAAAPSPARSAMLILNGADRQAVLDVLQTDPFMIHGLVDEMTITQWDPVFGTFAKESSGSVKS